MSQIKYSAIVGTLGQIGDRFLPTGYKEPEEIKHGFEEEVEALASLGVLDGLDLYYAEEGINSDYNAINTLFAKYDLKVASTFPNVFGLKEWKNGSLSSTDDEKRGKAIELCKKALDFNAGLEGRPPMNLWLGQDGFDYPFQTDYGKNWSNLVDAVREICDYKPEICVTLEAKVREPRNRCIIDTVANALLMCREIGRDNCALAIDIGHTWQAQQNVSQNIALANLFGKVKTLHANDNYNLWDDDLIAGSVRTAEYLEMFYYLKKINYDGYIAVDIFPFRESTLGCTSETVLNLKKFEELVDMAGLDRIEALIASGDPTQYTKFLRENIYR